MDHRYYYDGLDYAGPERRSRPRRRSHEIVAAGLLASLLTAAVQASGLVDGQAPALSCLLATVVALALHRPVVRLMRGEGAPMRMAGAR